MFVDTTTIPMITTIIVISQIFHKKYILNSKETRNKDNSPH